MSPKLDTIGVTLQKFFNKKMSKPPPGPPDLSNAFPP
jgi:hypothetical protein